MGFKNVKSNDDVREERDRALAAKDDILSVKGEK